MARLPHYPNLRADDRDGLARNTQRLAMDLEISLAVAEKGVLMLAAIYARKSTDQADRADEAKSVTRQVEHATVYALEAATGQKEAPRACNGGPEERVVCGAPLIRAFPRQRKLLPHPFLASTRSRLAALVGSDE